MVGGGAGNDPAGVAAPSFLAHQSPLFQQEFPSLSSGDGQGPAAGQKGGSGAAGSGPGPESQYGPGPSLRPQSKFTYLIMFLTINLFLCPVPTFEVVPESYVIALKVAFVLVSRWRSRWRSEQLGPVGSPGCGHGPGRPSKWARVQPWLGPSGGPGGTDGGF